MSSQDTMPAKERQSRFGILLICILVSYGVSLITADTLHMVNLLIIVQLITVWLALRASEAKRLVKVATVAVWLLVIVQILAAVAGQFSGQLEAVTHWTFVVATLLYLIAPIAIVRYVVRRSGSVVDLESLLAVICAYLMIGIAYAFVYRSLGGLQSTPFFGAGGSGTLSEDLFFSFITLTTVGYGDLVPASNPGQTLAVMEAMVGQLFLVIVVAKVVTGITRSSTSADAAADDTDQPAS